MMKTGQTCGEEGAFASPQIIGNRAKCLRSRLYPGLATDSAIESRPHGIDMQIVSRVDLGLPGLVA